MHRAPSLIRAGIGDSVRFEERCRKDRLRLHCGPIREPFDELDWNSEERNEEVYPTVELTAATERTGEVRALRSAKNPIAAWVVRRRLREDERFPPRDRISLDGAGDFGDGRTFSE